MRTEEKLESAMVEQRVLEIQECGFSVLFAVRFEISLGAILTQTRLNYSCTHICTGQAGLALIQPMK